jgi:Uncharacterized protein conserved in bacteria
MTPQNFRPEGYPSVIAALTVRNAEATIDFYQRAFGFQKKDAIPGKDGKIMHAEMTHLDGMVMLSPENPNFPCKAPVTTGAVPPFTIYVYCEDVDALSARARDAGAKVLGPAENMFWGDRICRIEDIDGYIWTFATKVGEFDPSKMPS